jgi:hypothetical protein
MFREELVVMPHDEDYNTSNRYAAYRQYTIGMIYFYFLCFNATFSNISAISWRPLLVVEEARVPRQPPTIGKQVVNFIIRVYGIKYKIFQQVGQLEL